MPAQRSDDHVGGANRSSMWVNLYQECFEEVVAFLRRRLADPDRARDLAQDAFARALDRDANDPRALLFAIAANLARDEYRSERRRERSLHLVRMGAETSRMEDPEERLLRRSAAERAREALAALSERDRHVLLLWSEGQDYKAIASRTGLSVTAIGTTLGRARRRLVEAYRKLEV